MEEIQDAWAGGWPDGDHIHHFHMHRVDIDTNPAMPVMADGLALREGPLHKSVRRHALAVMVGEEPPVDLNSSKSFTNTCERLILQ